MIPVPVGPNGVDLAAVAETVARTTPGLIYLTPALQTPTGTVMTESAGREIVRIAAESAVPVIDDRVLADIELETPPHRRWPGTTRRGW
ncbi:MAG TPA: hypothetical protein QGH28_03345 [Chloroflexota bacterium]|nr:hypothetical protein [Chloroflexota bacterium]